jgi:putative spermidine/putrescine transport system ATP-binding protein
MNTPPPLVLDGVSKRYGAVQALRPLNLAVPDGEMLAILGPSGCGKTTTLRIIAGFEAPDVGAVRIAGRDVTFLPPNKRALGMVFQNYSLFPHMTVAENVAFGLRMRGASRADRDRRVLAMLAMVRLDGFGDRGIHQLSGGQQQRIALARALAPGPRILLLDEPLGALDKNLREGMQFELRQIQRQLGITSILVTHDQEEALTMSDRVAVMHDGRVVQIGAPTAVYERPATRFVAEFLGTANVFQATVQAAAPGGVRLALDGLAGVGVALAPAVLPGVGAAVLAAVRPERMRLGPPRPGAIAAVVQDVVFRGASFAYELRAEGHAGPLFAYTQGRIALAAGEAVGLDWADVDAVLLQDGA